MSVRNLFQALLAIAIVSCSAPSEQPLTGKRIGGTGF